MKVLELSGLKLGCFGKRAVHAGKPSVSFSTVTSSHRQRSGGINLNDVSVINVPKRSECFVTAQVLMSDSSV